MRIHKTLDPNYALEMRILLSNERLATKFVSSKNSSNERSQSFWYNLTNSIFKKPRTRSSSTTQIRDKTRGMVVKAKRISILRDSKATQSPELAWNGSAVTRHEESFSFPRLYADPFKRLKKKKEKKEDDDGSKRKTWPGFTTLERFTFFPPPIRHRPVALLVKKESFERERSPNTDFFIISRRG